MNLRAMVNRATRRINPNLTVTVKASTGSMIGSGLRSVPGYAPGVDGPANIQALTWKELQHIDNLNLQGVVMACYLQEGLQSIVRVAGKGGDLIVLKDTKGHSGLIQGSTWLVVQILESWPEWTKAVIQLQTDPIPGGN